MDETEAKGRAMERVRAYCGCRKPGKATESKLVISKDGEGRSEEIDE